MSVHKLGGQPIPLQQRSTAQQQAERMDKEFQRAAQTYEKHFLREMVKAMRSTVKHGELTKPTMAEKIYTEKLDSQYVDSWGERGGIGLADVIYTQLKERFGAGPKMIPPSGPIQIDNSTTIRIDESQASEGIPLVQPKKVPQAQMNMIFYNDSTSSDKAVTTPWNGRITQVIRSNDDRQTIKIDHGDDRSSTISYRGSVLPMQKGDEIDAGQRLGKIFPGETALTWELVQRA